MLIRIIFYCILLIFRIIILLNFNKIIYHIYIYNRNFIKNSIIKFQFFEWPLVTIFLLF